MYSRVTVFVYRKMHNYSVKTDTELQDSDRIGLPDSHIGETRNEFLTFNKKLYSEKTYIIFMFIPCILVN